MGRFPRKCKLRGPSGVTVGSAYINCGSAYISPGPNCENPAKIRQILTSDVRIKIWAKTSENLSNSPKFGEKNSKIFSDF